MLMTMGRLRRLLREATGERVAIKDLKPGDVFKFEPDGPSYTLLTPLNLKSDGVTTYIKGVLKGKTESVVLDHNEKFSPLSSVEERFDSIEWTLRAILFWVSDVRVKIEDEGNVINAGRMSITYAEGQNADVINTSLRQHDRQTLLYHNGYHDVVFLRVDPSKTPGQRIVPKGAKIPDVIMQVIAGSNSPMNPEDIMRQVRTLMGQPYVPGVGMGYFTNTAKESLVSTGAIKRYGVGKNAKYGLPPDDEDKVPDMIVDVLIDNENKPMAPVDVMRQVNQRLGREHIEGDGADYFSDASPASLLHAGKIEKHGTGKRATYSAVMASSVDWRPNETVPEDYYAL